MTSVSRRDTFRSLALATLAVSGVVGIFALNGCSTLPVAQASQLAIDVNTFIQDVQSTVVNKTLTTQQSILLAQQITVLSTDVNNLNAGSAGTTVSGVLADVGSFVNQISSFVPEIAALVALAAPEKVSPTAATRATTASVALKTDFAKLQGYGKIPL
jgi:hypothetical protein